MAGWVSITWRTAEPTRPVAPVRMRCIVVITVFWQWMISMGLLSPPNMDLRPFMYHHPLESLLGGNFFLCVVTPSKSGSGFSTAALTGVQRPSLLRSIILA
jgi:hypothetical protein